ncbi:MAG: energy transducer TonB [Cyanobacteria bacterium P01_G01_bin.19]
MVDLKPENKQQAQDTPMIARRGFKFKHLLLFILGSAIAHALLFFLLANYEARKPVVEREENEPIEFVAVPPDEATDEPPPETNNRSTENSVAQQNEQPAQTPRTDELGEEITPEPEPAPAPTQASNPEPTPAPEPEPAPVPEPEPEPTSQDLISGSDAPEPEPVIEEPEPAIEEPVATRLPPATQPAPESPPAEGSAADLLGGDYKKTLADGGSDAFFSPEALAHETVLNPGQIDALRDVDLSAYFAEIKRRVKRNWNPSYSPEEQTTYLTFNIQKNGQLTNLQVTESSGSARLDRESIAAVRNSAPFDPLPPNFPLEALEIEFSFNIYLY